MGTMDLGKKFQLKTDDGKKDDEKDRVLMNRRTTLVNDQAEQIRNKL